MRLKFLITLILDSSGKMKPIFEYQSPFVQFASDMAFFEDRILFVD